MISPAFRLSALRRAAWLALLWERGAAGFWPVAAAFGVALSLAFLGLPALLPAWLHLAVLLLVMGGIGWLARAAWIGLDMPRMGQAERRLERDSGLLHRPFAALRDAPAGEAADLAVWRMHQAQARTAIGRLRLRAPDAGLSSADPRALRAGAALLLVASFVIAGHEAGARLVAAVLPGFSLPQGSAAAVIQAWIQPPAYTGLAPVFLPPGGGTVSVPVGSKLTISITGAGSTPFVTLGGEAVGLENLGHDSFQASSVLTPAVMGKDGALRVRRRFSGLAGWSLRLLANEKPAMRWTRLPGRAGISLATDLPWQVSQRWGVAALEAQLRPQGRPDLPVLRVPLPLPGSPRQASGEAKPDLSANPYAGSTMTGILSGRDVSGQTGTGEPAEFVLPARSFHHPLARAIADLRRRLALHPDQQAALGDELSALAEAPASPAVAGLSAAGVTLNLAAAGALLSAHPASGAVDQVQARLWSLALALDGALPDGANRALEEAREDLRRGLEDHAGGKLSDRALKQKLDALREALDRRMAEMARQAMKQGALQKFDPRTQHLSSSAIDRAIEKLEKALREGRAEDARQAMAQLNRMMERLKDAHIMSPQEAQQQRQQAQQGRQQMGAVQDMVQRETGLLDHAQARAPQFGGGQPGSTPPDTMRRGAITPQDLLGALPQGTEDPGLALPPFAPGPPPSADIRPDVAPAPDASAPGAPAPGAPAGGKTPPTQAADARTQRALHRALEALKQGVASGGQKPPPALEDARHAMQDAAGALSQGDDPTARDAIGRAIAALQQGGQAMSRQREGQGGSAGLQLSLEPGGSSGAGAGTEEGEDGPGDGHNGGKRDPFGRQVDGSGAAADDPGLLVPDEMEQGRGRAIQDELRRRGADRNRPKGELDYIDRLLKPF